MRVFKFGRGGGGGGGSNVGMSCFVHCYTSEVYGDFPETFKLLNIILVLPVGTTSVERSSSYMKLINTRIHNIITDQSLGRLIRIATDGPELSAMNFDEVIEIFFKQKKYIEELSFDLHF